MTTDPLPSLPKLPNPMYTANHFGSEVDAYSEDQLRAYGDAREAHARAQGGAVEPVAWLVELEIQGLAYWWTGAKEWAGIDTKWTTDPDKAVRFCRKQDAEAIAKHMRAIATEHMWVDVPRKSP